MRLRLLLLALLCAPVVGRAAQPFAPPLGKGRLVQPRGQARLLGQLHRHVPADHLEKTHREQVLDFVHQHADPFDRRNPVAHVTASAIVLSHDVSKVLLVHHMKLGRWLQPGGHGEAGERSGLEIARREVAEETQLTGLTPHPALPGLLDVTAYSTPGRGGQPAHHDLDLRYLLIAPKGSRAKHDPKESLGLRWFGWHELGKLGLDEPMMRALGKVRTLHL